MALFFYSTHNYFYILGLAHLEKLVSVGGDRAEYGFDQGIGDKGEDVETNNVEQQMAHIDGHDLAPPDQHVHLPLQLLHEPVGYARDILAHIARDARRPRSR
mgnify:CR=1 FL=1